MEFLLSIISLFFVPTIACYILIKSKLSKLTKFEIFVYYTISVVSTLFISKIFSKIISYLFNVTIVIFDLKYLFLSIFVAIFAPIFAKTIEFRYVEKKQIKKSKDNDNENK